MHAQLISTEDARLLSHVALLAAWEGDSHEADRIFTALQAVRPDDVCIRICRAMVFASIERFNESKALLEGALRADPDNAGAKSLLGFVLFSTGEHGWQKLLEEVVADGRDRAASELAGEILAEHREFQQRSIAGDPGSHAATPYA
jgi:predicted Zn-dependent protease